MLRKRVTIKEVAKKAGVSTATVSRVFNDIGPVEAQTRRRVQQVAKRLHYTPNAVGRSLSTKRTDAIGLLLPDIFGEFFSEVIRGADQTAQQNRYHLLVSGSHNHRDAIEAALRVMSGRVDGLVIMSPHLDAQTLKTNLPLNLPVVLLNCFVDGVSFDSLNIDNFGGACAMARHLIQHGHQRIAVIKGTEKNLDAEERLRGYHQALRENRIAPRAAWEIAGNFTEESGYEAVKKVLVLQPRPTAIFAFNDSMAIGALSALREIGVDIPSEIALAGFDDIPVARFLSPALSSVRVSIHELGAIAIQKLVHAIQEKNDHTRQHAIIPTSLSIRESCGCAKTRP
ncbi:MAG: LacI family DNA-binding transcriptional regulator [bacterium]